MQAIKYCIYIMIIVISNNADVLMPDEVETFIANRVWEHDREAITLELKNAQQLADAYVCLLCFMYFIYVCIISR